MSRRLVVLITIGSIPIIWHASTASAAISVAPDSGVWGVNGRIRAMVRIGDVVYLGGKFSNAVGPDGLTSIPRQNLAAIDVITGQVLPWAPQADAGAVFGMETDGSQIFVAGDFTSITWTASDGVTPTITPRAHFASIAADRYGTLLPIQASSNLRQRALALSGTTLYIGGEFSSVDGQPRDRLAAIDLASDPPGALLSWSPSANAAVIQMGILSNGNIMIGGSFTAVNGDSAQPRLAQLTPAGQLAPWGSHPTSKVLSFVVQDGNVYAGLGGAGNGLNGYDSSGDLLWTRDTNGDVQAVTFCQGQVIAGGHFGKIGPNRIPKLAAVDPVTGRADTTWRPKPAGGTFGVWSLLGTYNKLFAGGDFTSVGGQLANHYAQFSTGPAITGIAPTSGPVGTTVQISGKSLLEATQVDFNGTPAGFAVNTDSLITATVPAGATSGPIHVTTPEGKATSADNFAVLPAITGIAPTTGPVGTDVVITGTSFAAATKVKFDGVPALSFSIDSDTQITAPVPPSASTGPISVTTPSGTTTSVDSFTVTPTITDLTPRSGAVGDPVTITGTTLLGATAVSFNGTPATFVVVSRTRITATVPAGATTGFVTATTPDGTTTSPMVFKVLPRITAFAPMSGPVGTVVSISGFNFTGATRVKFNGTNAVFTVDSDTQITATVPAGATTGSIAVVTPAGSARSADTFTLV